MAFHLINMFKVKVEQLIKLNIIKLTGIIHAESYDREEGKKKLIQKPNQSNNFVDKFNQKTWRER